MFRLLAALGRGRGGGGGAAAERERDEEEEEEEEEPTTLVARLAAQPIAAGIERATGLKRRADGGGSSSGGERG